MEKKTLYFNLWNFNGALHFAENHPEHLQKMFHIFNIILYIFYLVSKDKIKIKKNRKINKDKLSGDKNFFHDLLFYVIWWISKVNNKENYVQKQRSKSRIKWTVNTLNVQQISFIFKLHLVNNLTGEAHLQWWFTKLPFL